MEVDWLDTVTSVVYLGGGGVWGLTGLPRSLQSFIWDVCVDWLGTVTSVVYLRGMGLTGLTVTAVVYVGCMR